MALDMLKKELSEIVLQNRILGVSSHNGEDAVVFLAVLDRRWQACGPIKANLLK